MEQKLIRRLNLLSAYAVISTLAFAGLFLFSFRGKDHNAVLDELTVKRINLTGEDGSLRMVLSNERRQHPGRLHGQDLPARERPAGIIFFNNEGDECGGLVAAVEKDRNLNSGMSFTMDNYHNDQVVQLLNDETYTGKDSQQLRRGLVINEYPQGADMQETLNLLQQMKKENDSGLRQQLQTALVQQYPKRRLFAGRDVQNNTGLFLYDAGGQARMKLFVDSKGEAHLQVIDSKGTAKEVLAGR